MLSYLTWDSLSSLMSIIVHELGGDRWANNQVEDLLDPVLTEYSSLTIVILRTE